MHREIPTLIPAQRSRHAWLTIALLAVVAACGDGARATDPGEQFDNTGFLTAEVVPPTLPALPVGLSVQEPIPGRYVGVYIPTNYDPSTNWPLAVLLHGATGSGELLALEFKDYAEAAGLVVVAPNSRSYTWDRLVNRDDAAYGPDVATIDSVLAWAFDRIAVDPTRVSLGGFSDGATYSILIGLKNGGLFSRIAAFSPCASVPGNRRGMPRLFISHGINDIILRIDNCSRVTVPLLRERGYEVEYVEYPSEQGNGHYVTPAVLTQGLAWLAAQ